MRKWSVCSKKGGVGKTTLSAMLAVYAHASGERVIIIDLDPSEDAKKWHSARGDEGTPPMVIAALPDNLGKVLEAAETLGMTLTIIDTAGKIDAVALAVMRAADLIICPTQPNFFDIGNLGEIAELLNTVGKLDNAVVVVNGLENSAKTLAQDFADAEQQASKFGFRVSPAYCVRRRSYVKSVASGKGVTEYKPKDKAATAEIEKLWLHLNTLNPISTAVRVSTRT
jgi:chromosome partitioning protein